MSPATTAPKLSETTLTADLRADFQKVVSHYHARLLEDWRLSTNPPEAPPSNRLNPPCIDTWTRAQIEKVLTNYKNFLKLRRIGFNPLRHFNAADFISAERSLNGLILVQMREVYMVSCALHLIKAENILDEIPEALKHCLEILEEDGRAPRLTEAELDQMYN